MPGRQTRPRLGSFSQPEGPSAPGTEACLRCGSTRLTRIRLHTPSGIDAVFVSCPACETTAWFAVSGDGTPLTPEQVGDQGPGGP